MATIATNERRRAEKEERQRLVLQLAKERRTAQEIARTVWYMTNRRVTVATVRKDIAELKAQGLLGATKQRESLVSIPEKMDGSRALDTRDYCD